MASEPEVRAVLRFLAAAYPNFQLAVDSVPVYARLLVDVDPDALAAAAAQHAAESRFFPTVAELREMAASLIGGQRLTGATVALEVWGRVLAEVRRGVGHPQVWKATEITDPLVLRAVESIGGWRMLATSTNAEDVAHRARFVQIYGQLVERERQSERLLPEVRERINQVLARRDASRLHAPSARLAELFTTEGE